MCILERLTARCAQCWPLSTVRGQEQGPFFQLQDGRPLTKAVFTSKVREGLRAIGLPEQNFAGHSFRIGAATTAASVGIEDSVIRTMGRWSSAAYLVYIRTPGSTWRPFQDH